MTRREADALRFLSAFYEKNGFAPSYEEMAEGLGVRSKASVHQLAMQLVRKGYAVNHRGSSRSLMPVRLCPHCGKVAA